MSDDVSAALRYIARLCPHSPISLVGFSLGGNLALKLAGEAGDCPPAGLDSVVAVAPPIDLVQCSQNIQRGLNWLYDRSFVLSLHRNLRERKAHLPERLDPSNLPPRLYQFDDQITAPLNGFADAEQYYRRSSAGPRLADVRVRTLIITAEDDPIVPASMFRKFHLSPHVRLHVTRHGGHLGFIGRAGEDPDHRWLDWRVVQAIRQWDRQSRALITSSNPPTVVRARRSGHRPEPGKATVPAPGASDRRRP
jgi:predicted alpha/beta-fold hydrolase